MDDILLTRQLHDRGYGKDELRRLERRGELTHLRRGAWVRTLGQSELTPEQRHLQLVTAVVSSSALPRW